MTQEQQQRERPIVIVQGTFHVEPGERQAFLDGRRAITESSRGEQGCAEYCFAADPLDPGRVVLTERWDSRDDLDAHLAAMRSGATPTPPREPRAVSSSVTIYTVDDVVSL